MSDIPKKARRSFLAALPAVASARLFAGGAARERVADSEKLASQGGKPVRATRLSTSYPGAQYYDEQEAKKTVEAIHSRSLFRWYGPSPTNTVARFERDFSALMGAKYALAVTSGTAALHCAVNALGVGPGDEMILPAWAWYSCYNAILLTGALPVFAETDESFNIDPDDIEKKITPRTKAIMVVHLSGCPADMDRVLAVARRHNLKVLEDSAQSVGAQYKGRRLGSIGDIGIFSFQISKIITAGEGGAVVTSNPVLFERASRFHDLGILRPAHKERVGQPSMQWFVGTNYRMNEMTGAVMCAQLAKLEMIAGNIRRNARFVKRQIQDLPGIKLRHVYDADGEIGLYVSFLFRSKEQRDQFVTATRAENVPASPPSGSLVLPAVPYIESKVAPHPEWPSFNSPQGKSIRYGKDCCPRTMDIFDRVANLPIGPKYTPSDLDDIVSAIRKVHRAIQA